MTHTCIQGKMSSDGSTDAASFLDYYFAVSLRGVVVRVLCYASAGWKSWRRRQNFNYWDGTAGTLSFPADFAQGFLNFSLVFS